MRNQLSLEQLQAKAPSIFATQPYEGMSDKYRFVPTSDILYGLMDSGFRPVDANQTNVRKLSKKEYARHIIRFQHPDFEKALQSGGEVPELVLLNSHDGTSSYQLMLGIFRMVCSNGMIVKSGMLQETRVLHRGPETMVDDVIDASFEVVQEAPKAIAQVEEWKSIELDRAEQEAYAKAAFILRDSTIEVPARELLYPRRMADKGTDLWRTMNVVQENIIRGGTRGITTDNKHRRVRGIKSVDADTKLNKALWSLTESLAEHKKTGRELELVH